MNCSNYPNSMIRKVKDDLEFSFLTKDIKYNSEQKQNVASIYSGSDDLGIKEGGINGDFIKYVKCNSNEFQAYQLAIKTKYNKKKEEYVVIDSKTGIKIPDCFEYSIYQDLDEYGNKKYNTDFGIAFHKFKEGYYPCGNENNKWMIYLVPPSKNDKFDGDIQYYKYTELLQSAIQSYNIKNYNPKDRINILRTCLYYPQTEQLTKQTATEYADLLYKSLLNRFSNEVDIIEFSTFSRLFAEAYNKNINIFGNTAIDDDPYSRINDTNLNKLSDFSSIIQQSQEEKKKEVQFEVKEERLNDIDELIKRHANILYIKKKIDKKIGELKIEKINYDVGTHIDQKIQDEQILYKVSDFSKWNQYFQNEKMIISYKYLSVDEILNSISSLNIGQQQTSTVILNNLLRLVNYQFLDNSITSNALIQKLDLIINKNDLLNLIKNTTNVNIYLYMIPLIKIAKIKYENDIINIYTELRNSTIINFIPFIHIKHINEILTDGTKLRKDTLNKLMHTSGGYKLFPNVNNSDLAIFYLHYYNELNKALKPNKKLHAAFLKKMKSIVKNKEKHINHMKYAYETPNDFNAKYGGDIKITSFKRLITKLESLDKKK